VAASPHENPVSGTDRRRLLIVGALRAIGVTVVVVAIYYLAPLDRMGSIPLWVSLGAGLVVLAAVSGYEIRAILRTQYPAVRAIEALSMTVPLFLVLFAAAYFLVARASPNNFNVHTLTRTDSLYFTVTVFATVGFGDITATSQATRLLVIAQMVLDLIVLGLVIRAFIGAVQLSLRQRTLQAPDFRS